MKGRTMTKIRHTRLTQGMSAARLATLLGVHESTVRRWELGRRTPDAATLFCVARVLGVSVEVLR